MIEDLLYGATMRMGPLTLSGGLFPDNNIVLMDQQFLLTMTTEIQGMKYGSNTARPIAKMDQRLCHTTPTEKLLKGSGTIMVCDVHDLARACFSNM